MTRIRTLVCLAAVLASLCVPTGARAAVEEVAFDCGGTNGIEAMENEYILTANYGACWFHLGYHTYDTQAVHRVGSVQGSLFSVEVELSPPMDWTTVNNWPAGAIAFEVSTDGIAWTTIHTIPWRFDLLDRKALTFSFDGGGALARFFRIRQPRSAAQGLSGYLDASAFKADLELVGPAPAPPEPLPPLTGGDARSYSCALHTMERIFEAHPCTFGGVNRYDSPSVFHTYPIGPSRLDRISGIASFGPWRSDDYNYDGGSRTELAAHVQTSVDGVNWFTVGTFSGRYGAPLSFDFPNLGARDASFVRIVPELMKAPKRHPALKHVRGFLLHSQIDLLDAPAS